MKPMFFLLALLAVCPPHFAAATPMMPAGTARTRPIWVTAYYPVWHQQDGSFPPSKIDFSAISLLIHFSVIPTPEGTIDNTPLPPSVTITPAQSEAVISLAHRAGCKVLLCVGGAASGPVFRSVLAHHATRNRLIMNLVSLVVARGYDGLDVDMESIRDADAPNYSKFIRELRAKLTAARPGLMLTAATIWEPKMFAQLQGQFDQINLMTYDLSGPWQGFRTWYNASLHGDRSQVMSPGLPYPSAKGTLRPFLKAGIAPNKLGIGIAFYGDIWTGATTARQSIQGVTSASVSYSEIMEKYYRPELAHWDSQAQAPYLSIPGLIQKDRKFISYDDKRLCAEKVDYARQRGLGGVIIWEIGDDYRPHQPAGQRNPLLKAMKTAWLGSQPTRPLEAALQP